MDVKHWRFPTSCPACQALAGMPYRSAMDNVSISIDLQCGSCRHEWTISGPSPDMVLMPKKDRRSSEKDSPSYVEDA